MNTQKTVDQMEQLKVHGMAKLYRSISEQPIHQQPEPHTLVGMLTEAEIQTRQQQKTQQHFCCFFQKPLFPGTKDWFLGSWAPKPS